MRIRLLDLIAFGPFTDKLLVFDETGLHVVYGHNEAGKSSALRGLKALLYGVEERTLDNFLHKNEKLRVKGCLRAADGHELTIVRRKGRKNTLSGPDGQSLDEQVLSPFLGGVTLDLFETLFGIDHQALVQGGREILEQKGEVGQALFSAALGSHTLHAVLKEFEDEADALFRPRGSTQTINAALRSFAELTREARQLSLPSGQWVEHHRALGRTTRALEKVQSELSRSRIEVNRLRRIQRVLPKLARRRELSRELQAMGDVVLLAEEFTDRRRKAVNGLETARALAGKSVPRLAELKEQLEALSINKTLLEQAENIEDLHARLGSHRKALQDRPHLEAERRQLAADAGSLLKEIRPDIELSDTGQLRPVLARRQAIAEIGSEKAVLTSGVAQIKSSLRSTKAGLLAARRDRDAIPEARSPGALHRAIAAARKKGDLDALIQNKWTEIRKLEAECNADLTRLTLWDGELEDLSKLAVPIRESVNVFENQYDELAQRLLRLEEKKAESGDAQWETSLRLDEIQRAGAVPSEADLCDARSKRDRVWQLLRRQWIDGEDISPEADQCMGEGTLPDAYETSVTDADDVSDRLRREAERVHAVSGLQAKLESGARQLHEIDRKLESHDVDKRELDARWRELWDFCGIVPRTPREMRTWLDDVEKLRDRVGRLRDLRREAGALEVDRNTHIQLLGQQQVELGLVGSASAELEAVLLESEMFVQQLDEARRKRESLCKDVIDREADVGSLTDDHQRALENLAAWEAKWSELMRSLGLRTEALPAEVGDFLEAARTVLEKQNDAEKLGIRVSAIDEDAASFRDQVAKAVASIGFELDDRPAEEVVLRLHSMLRENRASQTRCAQINEQIELAEGDIEESATAIEAMTDILDALCVEARCDDHNDLDEAERSSSRYLRLKAEIDSMQTEILETGEGATIEKLEAESAAVDLDALPGQIDELINRIETELEPKRIELAETKGREEKELEIMNGGDQAAVLTDQAHGVLAGIRTEAERYVRVKLAGRVLRDEIERYRKENQGPLIKRASAHFATLTLGSFLSLVTDFNERDEPVLVGVRPDGERVYVEGMSSGTRDQLYLALRLASLEKYMESAEPMPFIVDDVLVDFDDDRSLAALNALAELAEKTQIILFTHHSQVVEQARQLQKPVRVHAL